MLGKKKGFIRKLLITGTSRNYSKELNQSIGTSNIINVTFFCLALVTAIIYSVKEQYEISLPVTALACSMIGVYYITHRGGHQFSRLVLAVLPSISIALIASVKKYYLHHVMGTVGIMEYVVPKIILLGFVAIPLALFSLHEKKSLIFTLLVNAGIILFIDNILTYYKIDIASVELMLKPRNLLQFAIFLSISITVTTLYIYKKRSHDAQEETQRKNEQLTATEEELRQNIEELTIIQEKLAAQERDLQTIFDAVPQPIFITETKGRILKANRAAENFYAPKGESLIGLNTDYLFRNTKDEKGLLSEVKRKKIVDEYEVDLIKNDNSIHPTLVYMRPVRYNRDTSYLGSIVDLTTVKAMQKELEETNQELKHQHESKIKSIRYAETIQRSILPSKKISESMFPENFILYKPKDIVSGDFYWMSEHKDGKKLVGVIDCTGHGVPGAFVSMVGNNILSEIIYQKGILDPAEILDRLDKGLVKALQQEDGINDDGMDIGLCLVESIDNGQTKVTYSGSKNTSYFHTKNELQELKGDRRAIGGIKRSQKATKQFTNHEVLLEKGDMLYLTTDGFQDQHNGERDKLGSVKFKQLLDYSSKLEPCEQRGLLEAALAKHQAEEYQRDDITILGIRI
ncbi:SpoIIE family protein phosphatase [Sediminitomix flava]|uniref:PAS domain S-box-containing protein n=1 Tax=Sediminitomix flava TaxID=379075 RepID=A0A315Z7R1_SEDFL|nr:SpoIIE family protein phosphatase [Sediminitomix flava]PWJ39240.1 PAS domain S-box-containing protein [Sediminitomix flava]